MLTQSPQFTDFTVTFSFLYFVKNKRGSGLVIYSHTHQ